MLHFEVINKKRATALQASNSPTPVNIVSSYDALCARISANEITVPDGLGQLLPLIKSATTRTSSEGDKKIVNAMYGLALDITARLLGESDNDSGFLAQTYRSLAREAVKYDRGSYTFRVHCRDSARHDVDGVAARRWASESVIEHPEATPMDYALHKQLLASLGIDGDILLDHLDPFYRSVCLLTNSLPKAQPIPFALPVYEEYDVEMQAASWGELVTRCVDMLDRAQSEIYLRALRFTRVDFTAGLSLSQQASQAQLGSQRASKRIRLQATTNTVAIKRGIEKEQLKEILNIDELVFAEIEAAKPKANDAASKVVEAEFDIPSHFETVIELMQFIVSGLVQERFPVSSAALTRFRDACRLVDSGVFGGELYRGALLFFAENLPEDNELEVRLLECLSGVDSDRFTAIKARNAEQRGYLEEAESLWSQCSSHPKSSFNIHCIEVKQAIVERKSIALGAELPATLVFDYHVVHEAYDSAFDVFKNDPFAINAERLCQLRNLSTQKAHYVIVWTWLHLAEHRECIINALAMIQIPSPRPVLEWIDPDEHLLRHIIATEKSLDIIYSCWAALYGLPDGEPVRCSVKPAINEADWLAIAKLIFEQEREDDTLLDRLLEFAKSLGMPSPALLHNRQIGKTFLHLAPFAHFSHVHLLRLNSVDRVYARVVMLKCKHIVAAEVGKQKSMPSSRTADAPIRSLRRDLKCCLHSLHAWHLLGLVYREHASRLLLQPYTDISKNRALILRLLKKAYVCSMTGKESTHGGAVQLLTWMRSLGAAGFKHPLHRLRDSNKELLVSVDNLLARHARLSMLQDKSVSPATLLSLGKLARKRDDRCLQMRFYEAAFTLSDKKEDEYRYWTAFKWLKTAGKALTDRNQVEAIAERIVAKHRSTSIEGDKLVQAMRLIGSCLDPHGTQHAHLAFLATYTPSANAPSLFTEQLAYWCALFPFIRKPKTPIWHAVYHNPQDMPSKYLCYLKKYIQRFIDWLLRLHTSAHDESHGDDLNVRDTMLTVIEKLRSNPNMFMGWKELSQRALDIYLGGAVGGDPKRRAVRELRKLIAKLPTL